MKKILVPLAKGLEEIEAISIIDILRRGDIEVVTVGLDSVEILGSHNIKIIADTMLEKVSADSFDGIVLPGGMPGSLSLKKNAKILSIIQKYNQEGKLVGAICAAPMVLEEAGILDDRMFTIHPATIPNITLKPENQQVVEDGNIITGQASGAATLFGLTLVKYLQNHDKTLSVNKGMLYNLII